MSAPGWLEDVTRAEIENYLDFLESLPENERRLYIMYTVGWVESGALAPLIGAIDARHTPLCETTVFESDQVYEKVRELDGKWQQRMPGIRRYVHTSCTEAFRVDCATSAMFEDILFNTTVECEVGTPTLVQRKIHMRLRLDHELATQLARRWLNQHELPHQGPLPMNLSEFERKIGGWHHDGKFITCPEGVRVYA